MVCYNKSLELAEMTPELPQVIEVEKTSQGPMETNIDLHLQEDESTAEPVEELTEIWVDPTNPSFIDAYFEYNQIPMYEHDEEHTSFITDQGLNCYKAMPFGLKNAGATYQRLVNGMFKDLIGKSIEVYVDNIVVKSKISEDHIGHLNQMFNILRKY